jgi:putative iron-regulated protein
MILTSVFSLSHVVASWRHDREGGVASGAHAMFMNLIRRIGIVFGLLSGIAALGCSNSAAVADDSALRVSVVKNYASNLKAGYDDALADERHFSEVAAAFLNDPTEENLAATRSEWLASRAHYMLTEGARFYDGPIDRGPSNDEGLLNSWPLDEAFIDYTTAQNARGEPVVDETVGIVNHPDSMPEISSAALDGLNASGGDENISVGYHAVEFLLWGQALNPTGPGERPASDYDVNGPRKNADRRAQYLRVAIDGIVSHLQDVADSWTLSSDYRPGFEADPQQALTKMLTGLAKFSKGELGSQRIGAAYESKERHDQHDCFSSDTLVDYERDTVGVQNMYLGVYGYNEGPGIDRLVKAVSPALDAEMKTKIEASIDAIRAIPKPFEASIAGEDGSEGRMAILVALNALSEQGDTFGRVAAALGLTIQVDDPNQAK